MQLVKAEEIKKLPPVFKAAPDMLRALEFLLNYGNLGTIMVFKKEVDLAEYVYEVVKKAKGEL